MSLHGRLACFGVDVAGKEQEEEREERDEEARHL
jgi:hypothetical protein